MSYFPEYNLCIAGCCSIKHEQLAYNKKLNEKLNEIDLPNWSCPVCYDDIQTKDQILCLTFECSHLICYDCLKNMCIYSTKKKDDKHLKCPLCRAVIEEKWSKLTNILLTEFKVNKKWCRMYIPN